MWQVLASTFGYESFRGDQEQIVEHVVAGGDAVVLMPTGGGKSLCYQVPALVRDGCGVVVSPLIALMSDQVAALRELGVRAAYLNSTQNPDQRAEVVGRGVRVGIERVSRVFVPLFAVLMILLAIRSLTLPGATEGIVYLLTPDWDALTPRAGLAAMGQAFFSLSLGMGLMVTYGSYVPKTENMIASGMSIAFFDTMIAIFAGLIIFFHHFQ